MSVMIVEIMRILNQCFYCGNVCMFLWWGYTKILIMEICKCFNCRGFVRWKYVSVYIVKYMSVYIVKYMSVFVVEIYKCFDCGKCAVENARWKMRGGKCANSAFSTYYKIYAPLDSLARLLSFRRSRLH
jgi:hypothetical protein